MEGSHELKQLAHLMRIAASTIRDIGTMGGIDVEEIESLASKADTLGRDLNALAERTRNGGEAKHVKIA